MLGTSPNTQTAPSADRTGSKASYSITDLVREFDVTARTLRHYEDKGLIKPARKGTRRIYSRRDRARLMLVLRGKKVGFSLDEIREMLDLYDLRDGQATQLNVSLAKFRERIESLKAQRREIDIAIDELSQTCRIIEGLLRDRQGGDGPGPGAADAAKAEQGETT